MHVCAEAGCPEIQLARRCDQHASQREQQRGRRQQRGYGAAHDAARERLISAFVPGTPCPKCIRPMWDTSQLDAGHSEDLRDNPNAVADQLEHRGCNRGWRRGQ
jgi:hypothetical protein